jgi:two-component system, chemotaxis family, chemotaxis protein CheY
LPARQILATHFLEFLETPMPANTAMPILVVDDYQTMVRITRGMLKQIGFEDVDHAPDGVTALEMIRAKEYRLVISDWNMEPLSGIDLLMQLKSQVSTENMRFIMVTAESKTDRVIEARRAGVDSYIVKPFNAATLKSKIDQVFES